MRKAPWDAVTVACLNRYQAESRFHPFTCPNDHIDDPRGRNLVATAEGWICPSCDYRQYWAHEAMCSYGAKT